MHLIVLYLRLVNTDYINLETDIGVNLKKVDINV